MVKTFEELQVWQLAKQLAEKIYKLTDLFPQEEKFGLTSQIKNSSISVNANIAEGFGRYHYKDHIKFLYNSRGSLYETKSHLILAQSLFNLDKKLCDEILADIERLSVKLNNFISAIAKKTTSDHK